FGGQSPSAWRPESLQDAEARAALDQLIASAESAAAETPRAYQEIRLHDAVAHAWQPVARANEFIERLKPWAVAKDESRREELGTALAALLETLRLAALWAWPIVPAKSEELWSLLRLPGSPAEARGPDAAPRYAPR